MSIRHQLAMVLVSLGMLSACDKAPAPPKNDFEAYERKYVRQYQLLAKGMRARGTEVKDKNIPTDYRAVYIGASGVWIDRKLVATLAEIDSKRTELATAIDANAKLLPTVGFTGLAVTFDLDEQPAALAMSALSLFANRKTFFNTVHESAEVPGKVDRILCGETTLRDKRAPDSADAPQLSVLFDRDAIWIGLSKVNEFQEIPNTGGGERDFDKLQMALREHKASELFAERVDVELGVPSGTSGDVLHALETVCNVGFIDVALLPRDQLSAVPTL